MQGEEKLGAKLLDGLSEFLRLIEGMNKNGLTEKIEQGDLEGPFGSKIKYACRTHIGLLGLRPGRGGGSMTRFAGKASKPFYKTINGMPTKVIRPEDIKEKEGLVEIKETNDLIKIVIELPVIKKKDIGLKIVKNVLRITMKRPEGNIVKEISIPSKSKIEKIEKALFKNRVLEIILKKKKGV